MIVNSFVKDGFQLKSVELEVSLVPGLPNIKFLGQPDSLIRESEVRIKAALKSAGFEFPASRSILIQMRPMGFKKQSVGLDLAVAAAYLWESEQIPKPKEDRPVMYGELTFGGEVRLPDDFEDVPFESVDAPLWHCRIPNSLKPYRCVNSLKDLLTPQDLELAVKEEELEKVAEPESEWLKQKYLSPSQAEAAEVVLVGGHSCLLAGLPGAGKSTMAEMISTMWRGQMSAWRESRRVSRIFGNDLKVFPVRKPHHTSSLLSMVGGGKPLAPGEVSLAHSGVLILDEFLEFDQKVQEALRESLESGSVSISRAGEATTWPAKFVLVATTNLCHCGGLLPDPLHRCTCPNRLRRANAEKLSGPMLDRFHVISLFKEKSWTKRVPAQVVYERVQKAREFALNSRGQTELNAWLQPKLSIKELNRVDRHAQTHHSLRRQNSWMRVARSLADLDQSAEIQSLHLLKANSLGASAAWQLSVELPKYL